MKYCKKCRHSKELNLFPKVKGNRDGFGKLCKKCVRIANRKKRKLNRASINLKAKEWRDKNSEKIREYRLKKFKSKRKKPLLTKEEKILSVRAATTRYRTKFPERAKKSLKKHQTEHPESLATNRAKRRASKLQATPRWFNKGHQKEVKELYKLSKEIQWLSEEKLTLDHIIPLQGKEVSGLHVPWNLQILPLGLNISKLNRFDAKTYDRDCLRELIRKNI